MIEQRLLGSQRVRRIMATVIIGFLFLIIYITVWSYNRDIKLAESGSLMRLGGIANSLALQIDGDAHEALMKKHPTKDAINDKNQDSLYQQIHQILARNYEANMLKTPIYTIVIDSLSKTYEFGVTSSDKPYFRHAYNSAPKELMEKKKEGAMIPMYKDEFGMWLSAFAPIKNKNGAVVAMVQADEKFDLFLQRERTDILKSIFFSAFIFIIVLVILIKVLQTILDKELKDKIALANAHQQIQQLDSFRKEMITNISHDLRTPIANILGFTETLQQKKSVLSEQDRDKYLAIIQTESKRMSQLLRGLFDLSILESGQINLDKELLNMAELLHDVLQKYTLQAQEKNVSFISDMQENLPFIEADIKWMDRVIQNLLDNSIKYVNENGFIRLTLFTEGGYLHLKICNSGNPIPQEYLPQIFDRYFTAAKRTNTSTGLGLAIVKRVIDLHGGTIWAEVSEDVTTFRFKMVV
jgi:signal transduction histidine kinase